MDWHRAVTSVHHPVRQGRVQHQEPHAGAVDVVLVVRVRHSAVGSDSHHCAYPKNPQTSVVSKMLVNAEPTVTVLGCHPPPPLKNTPSI